MIGSFFPRSLYIFMLWW